MSQIRLQAMENDGPPMGHSFILLLGRMRRKWCRVIDVATDFTVDKPTPVTIINRNGKKMIWNLETICFIDFYALNKLALYEIESNLKIGTKKIDKKEHGNLQQHLLWCFHIWHLIFNFTSSFRTLLSV